jgi:di/tricarboxylate transporter
MTTDILLTLLVMAGALALFVWNRIRIEVVGLIVMVSLILLGLVSPREGISGFSNEAVVTVAAMFVLSAGLLRTGVIDLLGRWVARAAGKSELLLLLVSLIIVVPLSAFVNNTPVVVVMIPVILGISRKTGIVPSRIFMPVSFGSQFGGTLTLIGTSTNLLVAGLVLDLGYPRIGIFDITRPALVLTAIGLIYLLTIGRLITPYREAPQDLLGTYELRDYLTVLRVTSDSPFVGRSLRESRFGEQVGLEVVAIDRGERRISLPRGGTVLEAQDILIVEGKSTEIARLAEHGHLEMMGARPDFEMPSFGVLSGALGKRGEGAEQAHEESTKLAEMIVPPRSPVVGRSLRELNFRARFSTPVLGILRHGTALHERLGNVPLLAGDLLLVQGLPRDLQKLHETGNVALLGALDLPVRRTRKMALAIGIMFAVVAAAALEIVPIMVSSIAGAIAMFLTGCVKPDEAYEEIDWMVLVLLGSIIPLGLAMQKSGAAELIASHLVRLTMPLGLLGTLAAFYLLTSLLTEVISNNAAAVVLTPVAISTALSLEVSPLPFVFTVMLAASNSFMTPIGYQTNTFIFGPGGYRFSDFFRVGAPLNLLMTVAAMFVIPYFFPF